MRLLVLIFVCSQATAQFYAPFYFVGSTSIPFEKDSVSSYAASGLSATHQWSHTCTTTDTKGALIIGVSTGACEGTITSMVAVWGSGGTAQTATQIGYSLNNNCLITYMFKVMNPHVGTDSIYITINTTRSISGGGISYRGVSSVSAGTMANGSDATATVTVSSAAGRVVVGVAVGGSNNSFAAGSGVTERYEARETVGNKPGAGGTKAGEASCVFSMTLEGGADDWAIIAAELIP
jgi:hypothetical protein